MEKEKIKAFADKIYSDMAATMVIGMAYVGTKTGLFRAMHGKGAMNLDAVIEITGLHRRYVEEWLNGMAAAGYLEYDEVSHAFKLPDEHAYLVASEDTDHFMGGLFHFAPVLLGVAPKVADAFRTGGGVPFKEFGPECVTALDMMNSGQYDQRFADYWMTKLPDVMQRLESGGRVLDIGCGVGRVAISIAKAFPKSEVIGLDCDIASVSRARSLAENTSAKNRVTFIADNVHNLDRGDGFDLITACDCVHDFSEPHRTLARLRELLKPTGTLFIVEPKAADSLRDNMNSIAVMYYGFSIFHCMTQSLADGGPGLGTCLGPRRTENLLREAGFGHFAELDIKSQINSFYAAQL